MVALPAAAGVLAHWGIVLGPAVGAVLMLASTVICPLNARQMRLTNPLSCVQGRMDGRTGAAPSRLAHNKSRRGREGVLPNGCLLHTSLSCR